MWFHEKSNSAWLCSTLLDSARLSLTLLNSAWLCLTLLDSAQLCMTLLYSARLCSTLLVSAWLLDSAWLCSTLLDAAWPCSILLDSAQLDSAKFILTQIRLIDSAQHCLTQLNSYWFIELFSWPLIEALNFLISFSWFENPNFKSHEIHSSINCFRYFSLFLSSLNKPSSSTKW